MDVVVERCAGLDVGKDEVVGCVRTPSATGRSRRSELRTFSTFTSGIEELAAWLTANGVVEVVMEATGQYWKPIWYLLEDRDFDLKLVNAKHVKMVPGRKTDLADAAWLAELLEHGSLRSSFVPPAAIRELRDLTRYRKRLIQTHTAEQQRVQKVFDKVRVRPYTPEPRCCWRRERAPLAHPRPAPPRARGGVGEAESRPRQTSRVTGARVVRR